MSAENNPLTCIWIEAGSFGDGVYSYFAHKKRINTLGSGQNGRYYVYLTGARPLAGIVMTET